MPLITVAWPELQDTAKLNINSAQWSEGVKQSHLLRVDLFDEACKKLQERIN